MAYLPPPPAHSLHVGSVTMGIEHPIPIGGDFFQPLHHIHCINCGRPGHASCGVNNFSVPNENSTNYDSYPLIDPYKRY